MRSRPCTRNLADRVETIRRESARAAVVDDEGRVLLLHAVLPDEEWWELPGGGLKPAETHLHAALRELREETAIDIERAELLGAVDTEFQFDGRFYLQRETVFRAAYPGTPIELGEPEPSPYPRHVEFKWWRPAELRSTREHIHPPQLAELLGA
jgi:8-oxo-dGTP pyrophosphatase MutT (NUDIX family)